MTRPRGQSRAETRPFLASALQDVIDSSEFKLGMAQITESLARFSRSAARAGQDREAARARLRRIASGDSVTQVYADRPRDPDDYMSAMRLDIAVLLRSPF